MISRDEIKRKVQLEIDNNSDTLVRIAKTILDNPEPGYREIKTADLVAKKLTESITSENKDRFKVRL